MYEVDYTLKEIEDTRNLCWALKSEMDKKLQYEYEKYNKIFNELVKTIDKVCKDISCAENEKKYAQEIYEKNKQLKDKLKAEKEKIEGEVARQGEKIHSLEATIGCLESKKSNLTPPSPPTTDDDNAKAEYQSKYKAYLNQKDVLSDQIDTVHNQISSIKKDIEKNKIRINQLSMEINKIDSANIQLTRIISEISQSIIMLKQYKEMCQKVKNQLKYDFSYLYEKVRDASGIIESRCHRIEEIERRAEYASDSLTKLLDKRYERIRIYKVNNLELLNDDWEKMNIRLSKSKDELKECTEEYRKNIHDNISKDVEKNVKRIDESLKEIYDILKNKCKYSKELKDNLEYYKSTQ